MPMRLNRVETKPYATTGQADRFTVSIAPLLLLCLATVSFANADDILPPITQRFTAAGSEEVPSFQRHVSPLFGRLGCNGRACHGSFQGRGGFRLSLFGFDFKADHDALLDKEHPRLSRDNPADSLIITKPTDGNLHEGGKRYELGSWQHHALLRWIEGGAKFDAANIQTISRLDVTPSELQFSDAGQTVQLKAVAVWPDGTKEDVTPLCRFQSNDEQVAKVNADGLVTSSSRGDSHIVVFYDNAVVPLPVVRPVTQMVDEKYPNVATPTKIDELVVSKLKKLGVVPSDTCNDAEFLRRVRLDLTGTLPSPQEVETFLANASPDKRSQKVEELLQTSEYAAWWATRLCDYTGNNGRQLNNFGVARTKASQYWYDWIKKRIADNTRYDQLVAGIVLGVSRREGESYTDYCREMSAIYRSEDGHSFADRDSMPMYWARRNINQPEDKAIAFAYSFMGIRIQCAQCHKHPFDQWSKDDFDQFKKFFTGIAVSQYNNPGGGAKSEFEAIVAEMGLDNSKKLNGNEQRAAYEKAMKAGKTAPFPEVYTRNQLRDNQRKNAKEQAKRNKDAKPAELKPILAKLLGAEAIDLGQFEDLRKPLMDWLGNRSNPYLARAFVNRVWSNYFNVGIVEPADDMSMANPPSNKPLLDYLTQGFIDHDFDMKWLHREIINSRTYQLSWVTNDTNKLDERNFSRAVPRRLPAEVAYDAVQFATGSEQKVGAMQTKMTGRAIAIASEEGNQSAGFALTVFGRSIRESNCDCDRSSEASLLQTVFLQNDKVVLDFIESRDSWVSQVTKQLVQDKAAASREAEAAKQKDKNNEQTVKSFERKIERLKGAGRDEDAQKLQKELDAIVAKMAKKSDVVETNVAAKMPLDPQLVESLIKQAYLRTVSRYPTADEKLIATSYIEDAENAAVGLRGVLWALVNTKEFIVNH